jgi:hypothetical protein
LRHLNQPALVLPTQCSCILAEWATPRDKAIVDRCTIGFGGAFIHSRISKPHALHAGTISMEATKRFVVLSHWLTCDISSFPQLRDGFDSYRFHFGDYLVSRVCKSPPALLLSTAWETFGALLRRTIHGHTDHSCASSPLKTRGRRWCALMGRRDYKREPFFTRACRLQE